MDYSTLNKDQLDEYTELLFTPCESVEEIKNWIEVFLDLIIPLENVDPDSTSSPLDSIWQIYENFKNNRGGDESPSGYVLMSCREGMKTVSVALLEVMLLLHFELEISHAAATETQSSVGLSYIYSFLSKVEPLMINRGWAKADANKRTMSFTTPSKKNPYIKILICTKKGMNSLHCQALFLDELDLADPEALKEAKNIIGFSKGVYGLSIFLSTRKYAFGNMSDIIGRIDDLNYKLLSWNIIDVTEACPSTRHKPELPKEIRYVAKNLPLRQLDQKEFDFLSGPEQEKFDKIENVHGGCIKCPLLPVCRMRLADKPSECKGGFYKPITSVIQKFRENDPDTAEAQLMCWKPGSTGLVYPRLVTTQNIDPNVTNVISIRQAYKILTNKDFAGATEEMLLLEIKKNKIDINAGVDWGFTHEASIGITAHPMDEAWLLDCFSAPGMEFSDIFEVAQKFRDKYEPSKWWVDQARPEYMVTFNKDGMKCPKFTKDVIGGISAVRAKIVDGTGRRKLKIIATENNKKWISALSKHKFILDSSGEPTDKPADEPGIADIADMTRYIAQNKFPVKGAGRLSHAVSEPKTTAEQVAQTTNNSFLKAVEAATGVTLGPKALATKKKNGFYFSW